MLFYGWCYFSWTVRLARINRGNRNYWSCCVIVRERAGVNYNVNSQASDFPMASIQSPPIVDIFVQSNHLLDKKKTQLIYKFRWYVRLTINRSNCKSAEVSQTRRDHLFSLQIFQFAQSQASWSQLSFHPWRYIGIHNIVSNSSP